MDGDSPLSFSSNIISLLTLVVTVIIGVYARALTFQARLRYRDEILKAILDTMGAFSETSTLAFGYGNLKNEAYVPHREFNNMLVNLYVSIFEQMAIFLDLGCKKSILAARAVSKRSARWKSLASEIESELSKARQIYYLARLQDNILERTRFDHSPCQNMGRKASGARDEISENIEGGAMSMSNAQNALAPDESNIDKQRSSKVIKLMMRAWNTFHDRPSERSDKWRQRETLLKRFWHKIDKKGVISTQSETLYPPMLCMAVILSMTSTWRHQLQTLSKEKRQIPSTNDPEAQKIEMTTLERISRHLNEISNILAPASQVVPSARVFLIMLNCFSRIIYGPFVTWHYDTSRERNHQITELAFGEISKVLSGTAEMNTRWVVLKHMLEED